MARNLVIIVADTLRLPGTVRGYRPERVTPFLSTLIAKGWSLDRFIASSPWTLPSHASLLQGVDPWEVHHHREGLTVPRSSSIAEEWEKAGGESLAFSANGLVAPEYGMTPGYSRYNPSALNRWVAHRFWRVASPVLVGLRLAKPGDPQAWETGSSEVPGGSPRGLRTARLMTSLVHGGVRLLTDARGLTGGLDRTLRTRRSNRPLHLFINLMEVHEPYTLRVPAVGPRLPPRVFLPMLGLAPNSSYLGAYPGVRLLLEEAYLQALGSLDRRLRDLFEVLRRREVLSESLVVVVSDHGQELGEHGFYGHGQVLHDEVVRVPCHLWTFHGGSPGPAGTRTDLWVDHRHLHDALAAWVLEGHADLTSSLETSIERRGPAISYWEGPQVTRPARADRPPEYGPESRSLRMFTAGGETVATDLVEGERGELRLERDGSAEDGAVRAALRRVLEASTRRVLTERHGTAHPPTEVEARLRSWGYL